MNDNGFSRGHFQPSPIGGTGWLDNGVAARGRGTAPAIYRPTMTEELLYPAEITSDATGRRDYSGNHIYILNRYLPNRGGSNTDNLGAVLAWERLFDSPTPSSRFRLHGGFHLYRADGFQTFYISHPPVGSVTVAGTWGFAQNRNLTTPLYLYVTNDLELAANEANCFDAVYSHGFVGVEPAAFSSAQIDFYGSRRHCKRQVNVQSELTLNTPCQVTISAISLFTEPVEYVIVLPPGLTFNQTYPILSDYAEVVSVTVAGGGAATGAAQVSITYMESEAS